MNRRGFLSAMLRAGAGFAVLPSALTYARTWQPTRSGLVMPSVVVPLPLGVRYHGILIRYTGGTFADVPLISEIRLKLEGRVMRSGLILPEIAG